MDPNLFRACTTVLLVNNVEVVDLDSLFKMKAATLVSRCSEKDLYDLIWLFGQYADKSFEDLIRLGNEIDAGVNGEAILLSVAGAIIRKDACGFSFDQTKAAAQVYNEIIAFRQNILRGITAYLEKEPVPELGDLIRKLQKFRK